jgi:hypothetical protein
MTTLRQQLKSRARKDSPMMTINEAHDYRRSMQRRAVELAKQYRGLPHNEAIEAMKTTLRSEYPENRTWEANKALEWHDWAKSLTVDALALLAAAIAVAYLAKAAFA